MGFESLSKQFAHIYFLKVLLREIKYFDDFITLIEGLTYAHLPALRKEVERYICSEINQIQADLDPSFAKKLLLVSEKYNLEILKMVIHGYLVDRIIGNSNPPKELVNITHELQQMAHEIRENENIENLVGTVVTDLQELTRRVRRVSLSHSPSQSSHSSSPLATPTNGSGSPSVPAPFDSPTSRFKRVSLA
uniref:GED domain-containing protein n=1 Tax=Caenorhabditis tropicalis TaxID=1561998 RepID=A0A1I7TKN9_9PELO